MEITNTITPENSKEWSNWLKKNHNSEDEIWLVYYKKHTNHPTISYDEAVEEALCFGWIDSTVKSIDDQTYCQKFTPRKKNSQWSQLNKLRVEKLIKEKRMTTHGLKRINEAKQNGNWDKPNIKKKYEMPTQFANELNNNKDAALKFNSLSPSHKQEYFNWIASAKKDETKVRRSKKAIKMLLNDISIKTL